MTAKKKAVRKRKPKAAKMQVDLIFGYKPNSNDLRIIYGAIMYLSKATADVCPYDEITNDDVRSCRLAEDGVILVLANYDKFTVPLTVAEAWAIPF